MGTSGTNLFPPNDEPIAFRQGQTGDCYLLAVLECLYNSNPQGRELIQSMFEYDDTKSPARVNVRIKRNANSEYIDSSRINRLKGQGTDFYIETAEDGTQYDVFSLTVERVQALGSYKARARHSNAYALYILEHIAPYYFKDAWVDGNLLDTLAAHKNVGDGIGGRFASGTCYEAAAQIFGVQSNDMLLLEMIIALKLIHPECAMTVGMSHLKNGEPHGGHAWTVKEIRKSPSTPGGYEFILINPHNTRQIERYSLEEMQKRDPRFAVHHVDNAFVQYTERLSSLKMREFNVIKNDAALSLLFAKLSSRHELSIETFDKLMGFYKENPAFAKLYNHLPQEQQEQLLNDLVVAEDNIAVLNQIVHYYLDAHHDDSNFVAIEKLSEIHTLINTMDIDFSQCQSIEEVNAKHAEFVAKLNTIVQDESINDALNMIQGNDYDSMLSRINLKLEETFTLAQQKAEMQIKAIQQAQQVIIDAQNMINEMEVDFTHCQSIEEVNTKRDEIIERLNTIVQDAEAILGGKVHSLLLQPTIRLQVEKIEQDARIRIDAINHAKEQRETHNEHHSKPHNEPIPPAMTDEKRGPSDALSKANHRPKRSFVQMIFSWIKQLFEKTDRQPPPSPSNAAQPPDAPQHTNHAKVSPNAGSTQKVSSTLSQTLESPKSADQKRPATAITKAADQQLTSSVQGQSSLISTQDPKSKRSQDSTLQVQDSFKIQKGINASIVRPDEILLKALLRQQGQKEALGNKEHLNTQPQIDFHRDINGNNTAIETTDYRIVQKGNDNLEVYDKSGIKLENSAREIAIGTVYTQLCKSNPTIIQEAHLYHIYQRLEGLFKAANISLASGQWISPNEIKSINKNYRFDETKDWKFGRLENGNLAFCNTEGVQLEFKRNGEISVTGKDGTMLQGEQRKQELEKFSNCFKHIENAETKNKVQFELLLEESDSLKFSA